MKIHRYSSLEHYAEHIAPIWEQLPPEVRGCSWAPHAGCWWGDVQAGANVADDGYVLVASYGDAASGVTTGRPLVYVEHGAGQTYEADEVSAGAAGWSGTRDPALAKVRMFVCPNETVADRWRRAWPDAVAVAVGCPKLDAWHHNPGLPPSSTVTVAVTFHWDCTLVPESTSAWPHYDRVLPELAAWCETRPDVRLLGHGHPRIWSRLARRWTGLHVDHTPRLTDVFAEAHVLVADNTSAMYEFASLGRPVVALNAPQYRRHIEHGLRFWSHVPGIEVDEPGELVATVARQVADPTLGADLRASASAAAYAHRDGRAADRAAAAIMETLL